MEWKTGKLSKIPNHSQDFGLTDCISETEGFLVVSSYDLDTGCGAVNLLYRDPELQDLTYLASLADGETGRVVSLTSREQDGRFSLVTGGHQVRLWTRLPPGSEAGGLRAEVRSLISSQSGSESELSEDESQGSQEQPGSPFSDKNSGFCNCNLM